MNDFFIHSALTENTKKINSANAQILRIIRVIAAIVVVIFAEVTWVILKR